MTAHPPADLPADPPAAPQQPWPWLDRIMRRSVPFLGLVVSVVLTLALDRSHAVPAVPAAVLVAGWLVTGTLLPGWALRGPVAGAVWYAGLTAATLALCLAAPWFGFLCAAGYTTVGEVLRGRRRLAGVAATAACASLSQGGGLDGLRTHGPLLAVMMLLVNLPIAGGLAWLGWVGEELQQRQRHHIDELTAAYERLERLADENAGLHAQLLVQAREAGVLDERARLAREIHDTLAQGLTGIIAQLRAAQALDGPADPERDRHLRTALDLARESLAEARRSVRAMAPRSLDAASLPAALARTAADWSGRQGVVAQVHVTGTPVPLHGELEAALLRTAQEALSNVAKHAGAARVAVTLSYLGDQVALDVVDDGVGFDVPAVAARTAGDDGSRFGLLSMRQRVQRVAGSLEIDSEPGGGTAVSARVPAIGA